MTADTQAPPGAPAAPPAAASVSGAGHLPRWAAWTIGIACIAVAWFVALATPGEEQIQAPFRVPAAIGEAAIGRNLAVTFTDIRRASEVSASGWTADGNWLVVDLEAEAVTTEIGTSIQYAKLELDGMQFDASERPPSFAKDGALEVGIPREGSFAFELPDGLDAGDGRIELALNNITPELDSMIVLSFDLGDVESMDQTELLATGWVGP